MDIDLIHWLRWNAKEQGSRFGEAADEIERLREVLSDLLDEAEDVFVCMADATGIDRHNYPEPYLKARAALKGSE